MNVAETIKKNTRKHLENGGLFYGQCVSAVGWIGGTVPEMTEEEGIIELSQDQRLFKWKTNGRKLFEVPMGEHPNSALAAWFKTDEGMSVYQNIEKRLK